MCRIAQAWFCGKLYDRFLVVWWRLAGTFSIRRHARRSCRLVEASTLFCLRPASSIGYPRNDVVAPPCWLLATRKEEKLMNTYMTPSMSPEEELEPFPWYKDMRA